MSKTYRSMFFACGACKRGLESDVKYCKYCGKTIWLKDASENSMVMNGSQSVASNASAFSELSEITNQEHGEEETVDLFDDLQITEEEKPEESKEVETIQIPDSFPWIWWGICFGLIFAVVLLGNIYGRTNRDNGGSTPPAQKSVISVTAEPVETMVTVEEKTPVETEEPVETSSVETEELPETLPAENNISNMSVEDIQPVSAIVTATVVKIRSEASTQGSVVASVLQDEEVIVTGRTRDKDNHIWWRVSYSLDAEEVIGFVRADLLLILD